MQTQEMWWKYVEEGKKRKNENFKPSEFTVMWLKVPLLQTKHILVKYKADLLHLAKKHKTQLASV